MDTAAAKRVVKLHPGQAAVFKTDARFTALIAGTGGGKTWTGPWWLAREVARHPTGTFGVGAPTYPMLSRVTVPALIEAFQGTDLEGIYKQSDHTYHLPTGGLIYCCSTDNPDHIEGGQYRAWWLDEAGQMKAWTWKVIQARLGFHMGNCLFTTTPYSLNWLYRDVYLLAKAGDPDYFVSQFASILNPSYPKAEFERARKTMDERTFALRYLGEFRRMIGLVWPEFDTWICQASELQEALEKRKANPQGHINVGGIDWGYNNPFVALQAFRDPDDVLWVYKEHYAERKLLKVHAESLDSDCSYWADPSGLQERQELQAYGIDVKPSDNNVSMGIERVTARGRTGRLKIGPGCNCLISEAETYHYKEDSDKPVKDNDHATDSLRYMIMGLDGKPEPKVIVLDLGTKPGETIDGLDEMETEDPRYWREY